MDREWQEAGHSCDPKNIFDQGYGNAERGREICDPESDGWYWLNCIYDGRAAYGKEVWMPYVYQNENDMSDAEKKRMPTMSTRAWKSIFTNA